MDIIKARKELLLGKTIYDMNLRVVDYGRVSTDKDNQVNSLTNQINYFNEMISSIKNWTHIRSYSDEGISGTRVEKREEFLRMIEDARLGKIDLILTKEVSRFARNTIDSISYTQTLLKYGVIVFFISDNINTLYPDSEFRLTLMASMAQDEVRKLSERVKFGIKRSIKDRKVGGGGLYGYIKKDCKLIINEKEAPAVRMLYSLYSSGEYGFKKIGEELASNGYYTKKGKIFSDTTLKKMLNNPRYKGYYTANMSEVEDYKTHRKVKKPKDEWIIEKDKKGDVPAIVSEELWEKANEIYKEKNNKWNKNVLNKEYYLENRNYTSKIFCIEHKKTFIRSASGKRKNNPVWQCGEYLRNGIKGCASPRLFEKDLNNIFSKIIENIIDNKETLLNMIINDYITLIKDNNTNNKQYYFKQKLQEQQIYKDKLFDMFLKELITDIEFLERNNKISSEISTIKKTINKLEANQNSLEYYEKEKSKISKEILLLLNIEDNIGKYFNLFINKVLVSKINNNRKNIKLTIIFNYKYPNKDVEFIYNNKDILITN